MKKLKLTLSLLFATMLLCSCGQSKSVSTITNTNEENTYEIIDVEENNIEESITTVQESEDLSKQISVTEYTYEVKDWDYTLHYLIIKNNSNKTIQVSSNSTALNSKGDIIGAADGEINALGAGCTSYIKEYFDGVTNAKKFNYELYVEESDYYEDVINDLNVKISKTKDKIVVSCTNNGSESAEFVEGLALFFKNGKLVDSEENYITDKDSEIKSGKTISQDFKTYEKFDDVKFYLSGRKNK
ncbi:MAG: hypothetical protein ACLRZ9_05910 [Eubacterium sp.]